MWVLGLVLLSGSCVGFLPVSWSLADPLVNRVYDPESPVSVLLLFPDRVEIRRVDHISSVSPRTPEAAYQFLIPRGRRPGWQER
jgi:hypothetical protein